MGVSDGKCLVLVAGEHHVSLSVQDSKAEPRAKRCTGQYLVTTWTITGHPLGHILDSGSEGEGSLTLWLDGTLLRSCFLGLS